MFSIFLCFMASVRELYWHTVYMRSFIKTGSGIQKIMGGGRDSQTHRYHGNLISLLSFFYNKESRLRKVVILTVILHRYGAGPSS
jgi:hypothetical protein